MSILIVSATGHLVQGDRRLSLDAGEFADVNARFLCVHGGLAHVGYLREQLTIELSAFSIVKREAGEFLSAGVLKGQLIVGTQQRVGDWRVMSPAALQVVSDQVFATSQRMPVQCGVEEGIAVRDRETYFCAIEATHAPVLYLGDTRGRVSIWRSLRAEPLEDVVVGSQRVVALCATASGVIVATEDGVIADVSDTGSVKQLLQWPLGFSCGVADDDGLLLGDDEGAVHRFALGKLSRVAELSPELGAAVLVARV